MTLLYTYPFNDSGLGVDLPEKLLPIDLSARAWPIAAKCN